MSTRFEEKVREASIPKKRRGMEKEKSSGKRADDLEEQSKKVRVFLGTIATVVKAQGAVGAWGAYDFLLSRTRGVR